MKYNRMKLNIFDGGTGGQGSQGGDGGQGSAGSGSGTQNTGNYTYEQLEEIASARAEKASRTALANFFRGQGMSEEEVTKAIGDFKRQKAQNQPNISAIEQERDAAQKELQQLKNTNILRDKGVKAEDLDYVMFKVEKLVDDKTDFTKAAEKFLKENPKFTGAGAYRVSTSSGAESKGTGGSLNSSINDAIRNAIRR